MSRKKKSVDPNKTVVGSVLATRELEIFNGKLPDSSHPQVIERPDYTVYFINAADQRTINELENTRRGIGTIRSEGRSPSDEDDEIIFVLKK